MLNQKIIQDSVDERVLPGSGLITTVKLLQFSTDSKSVSPDAIRTLIDQCEKNNIFVMAILPDPRTWLVCLDDFNNVGKNVTE